MVTSLPAGQPGAPVSHRRGTSSTVGGSRKHCGGCNFDEHHVGKKWLRSKWKG